MYSKIASTNSVADFFIQFCIMKIISNQCLAVRISSLIPVSLDDISSYKTFRGDKQSNSTLFIQWLLSIQNRDPCINEIKEKLLSNDQDTERL